MTNNQIAYLNLQEQKRSHQANEVFNLSSLEETKRHNVATEDFNLSNLAETVRSNKAREDETARHNKRTEGETVRHNLESESIQKTSALAEKAYKEAMAALNSQRLDFDKNKELTRIAESLRDYLERVRANDLDALTSRTVGTLLADAFKALYGDSNGGDSQSTNVTVNIPTTETKPSSSDRLPNNTKSASKRGGGISRGYRDGSSSRR